MSDDCSFYELFLFLSEHSLAFPSPVAYARNTLHCPEDFSFLWCNDVEKFCRLFAIFLAFLHFTDAHESLADCVVDSLFDHASSLCYSFALLCGALHLSAFHVFHTLV